MALIFSWIKLQTNCYSLFMLLKLRSSRISCGEMLLEIGKKRKLVRLSWKFTESHTRKCTVSFAFLWSCLYVWGPHYEHQFYQSLGGTQDISDSFVRELPRNSFILSQSAVLCQVVVRLPALLLHELFRSHVNTFLKIVQFLEFQRVTFISSIGCGNEPPNQWA